MSNAHLPRRIEDYARIVFDCDGVILDSNRLKSEMMGRALDGEPPEHAAAFVAWHRENGGISRYVKFRHFYTEMYPADDPEPKIAAALDKYATLVRAGLLACDELPGIRNLLKRIKAAAIPAYVNSGGDEEELRDVFAERGLDKFFAGIYGSPATKTGNLVKIHAENDQGAGLFIGDAKSDLEAALGGGLDFLYVSAISEWEDGPAFCAANAIPMIEDFRSLETVEPEPAG